MEDYRKMFKVNSFKDQRFGIKDHRTKMERDDSYLIQRRKGNYKRKKLALFNID
jgi:hypothetical protein